jgi:predicted cobalt transporter CbtA
VAPALGLPPGPRQRRRALARAELWWVATVAATAAGLWLLAFGARPVYRLLGVIVLCAPHVAGAPLAPPETSAVPCALVREFLYATYGVNAMLWLIIGGLTGMALRTQKWR